MSKRILAIPLAALTAAALAGPVAAQNTSEEQAVVGWYREYLGRDPEPQGYQERVNQLRSGVPARQVQAEILASDEFLLRAANGQPWDWMHTVYRAAYGREGTHAELSYWARYMPTGAYEERVQVALGILGAGDQQPQRQPLRGGYRRTSPWQYDRYQP